MANGTRVLTNCDTGITIKGVEYLFPNVDSIARSDERAVHLTRGVNSTNKYGIVYTENSNSPTTFTFTLLGLDKSLADVLEDQFNSQIVNNLDPSSRVSAYIIERGTNEKTIIGNAIIAGRVYQASIAEGRETMNVDIVLESFDVTD